MSKFKDFINDIIGTATMSYYTGRAVKLTTTFGGATSYYTPMTDTITFCVNNIIESLISVTGDESLSYWTLTNDEVFENMLNKVGKDKIETIMRNTLYHETSHVLLSPEELYQASRQAFRKILPTQYFKDHPEISKLSYKDYDGNDVKLNSPENLQKLFYSGAIRYDSIVNIFEDQRIETIMKDYYLKVDFRQGLFENNPGYQNDFKVKPKDTAAMFYELCRFQHARNPLCKTWINRINDIIYSFAHINALYKYDCRVEIDDYVQGTCPEAEDMLNMMYQVFYLCVDIYFKYFHDPKTPIKPDDSDGNGDGDGKGQQGQGKNSKKQSDGQSKGQGNGQSKKPDNPMKGSGKEVPISDGPTGAGYNDGSKKIGDTQESARSVLDALHSDYNIKTIKETSDLYPLKKTILQKLEEKFIATSLRRKGNIGYGGKLKVRYLIRPNMNDGKIFYRQNPEGGVKGQGSKKRINLWLDWSGSYGRNCEKTNAIISSIASIEKSNKNFDFNVIAVGGDGEYKTKLLAKNERRSESTGNTNLNAKKMNSIYRQLHNDPTAKTIDLVLFDGSIRSGVESLALFNNRTSHFIVDPCVNWQRNQYAPSSRCTEVYNGSYPEQLAKNMAEALRILL